MKMIQLRAALLLAIIGVCGCSGSDVSEVSDVTTDDSLAVAAILPARSLVATGTINTSTSASLNQGTDELPGEIEPFRNPFAPPKNPPPPPVVEEPEPEIAVVIESAPEIRQPGTPPKIRLLGFMNIGEPKVLVAYRDELSTLAIGDTLEDMQVVTIESPDVTMLFEEREIKFSLFDQGWQHDGGPATTGNSSRPAARPRSTQTSRTNAPPSSSGAASSNIPGFGPNAGKPPGYQRPTSSGTPPPGLPGLRGETGGIGIELPRMPGLDFGPSGNPGPSSLPTSPGGL